MHSLSPLLFAALTAAKVYTIDVGESGLHLSPQTISPAIGDTVIFHLYPRHNVVQTSFSSPCVPSTGNGFFSGPFDNTDNGEKKFVVNVTTTSPVWYYCAVPTHCQKGMVGGWNVPEEGNTIEAFASAAEGVDTSEAPSSMRGGQLLDDEQIMSLTATGSSSPSTTASGSGGSTTSGTEASTTGTGSETAATASSTGAAADVVGAGQVNGVLAVVLGLAAWVL